MTEKKSCENCERGKYLSPNYGYQCAIGKRLECCEGKVWRSWKPKENRHTSEGLCKAGLGFEKPAHSTECVVSPVVPSASRCSAEPTNSFKISSISAELPFECCPSKCVWVSRAETKEGLIELDKKYTEDVSRLRKMLFEQDGEIVRLKKELTEAKNEIAVLRRTEETGKEFRREGRMEAIKELEVWHRGECVRNGIRKMPDFPCTICGKLTAMMKEAGK